MSVTVSGLSGLTNAYVSVLSARGSPEINGASRWLDASAVVGVSAAVVAASTAPVPARARSRRRRLGLDVVTGGPLCCMGWSTVSSGRLPATVGRPLERVLDLLSQRRRRGDRVRPEDGPHGSSKDVNRGHSSDRHAAAVTLLPSLR